MINNGQAQNQTENKYQEEIIQKEAKLASLQQERIDNQKRIDHIQKSNTWKLFRPLQKVRHFFIKLFRLEKKINKQEEISQLQTKLLETEQALYEAEERLAEQKLDDRLLNSFCHKKDIRDMKVDGSLVSFLDKTVLDKQKHEANYNETLTYAARLFMNEEAEQKNLIYSKVVGGLKTEDIPEFMIRAGLTEENSMSLKNVASFRASLSMRMRQKQLINLLPEFTLENKMDAYHFIDQFNIRRPEVTEGYFSMEQLPKKPGTVIKPTDGAGSRGVYIIHHTGDIINVRESKKLGSLIELEENMQKDLMKGWVSEDQWMAEELILEDKEQRLPASDLKFYCFYGNVGLILEIVRYPERKHTWWTATGERIRTGKYEEALFKGRGVSESELAQVAELSLHIPAPFIRIDFLRSEDALVFGEFTAKPGNYDDFDTETDEWLGNYYIEAEGRLVNDLLNGKQFEQYQDFMQQFGYSLEDQTERQTL